MRVVLRQEHGRRRCADVHRDVSDRRVDLEGVQPSSQRLEVALRSGRERPVEVDGQRHRVDGGPRRAQGGARGCASQPTRYAGVEGRDESGDPRGVGPQVPRAHQAGDVAIGMVVQRGLNLLDRGTSVVVEQLRVRPRPAVGQVGQLGTRSGVDVQHRQRRASRHRHRHPGPVLHDDEHQPGRDASAGPRTRRGEQPGELGLVEVDRDQVVRLDVGGARPGGGPHDHRGVQTDDVARPVERHRRGHRVGDAGDAHADVERRPDGQR